MKNLSGAPLYGRLLALPTNTRLGRKRVAKDKHSSLLRKSEISFMMQAPVVCLDGAILAN